MATLPSVPTEQTPQMSYRTQRKFELREADFGKDTNDSVRKWVHEQIETRRKQLEKLHKNLVPEWRRIAEGKPRDEKKSWPFENCSNLVHQLVGQTTDDTSARVVQLLWATSPLAIFRYFTKSATQDQSAHNADKARVLEQFIDYAGYEPTELNLWDVENLWFSDSGKLGTAFCVVRPEQKIEAVYVGYHDTLKKTQFEEATLYEGPKVSNLRFEDVGYDPNANGLEESSIVYRIVPLSKRDLQERAFQKHYKAAAVKEILGKPDRYGPGETKKKENRTKGIAAQEERALAEWDVYECYFYWYKGHKKYRLICWYHFETKTMLNQVFNFIPDNQLPIVRTRLSSDSHGMLGRGYADMLKDAQEEISTAKNQRNDAITWGILGINRISPQNKNIDRNFKIYPGAGLPFGKDEFEHFDVGSPAMANLSLQNEEAMIRQASERAGVGPAVAGSGSGSFNKKGQYGSMGTLAVMQDGNTRANHRSSDFRHSHIRLIGLVTDMYGAMGLGRKGSLFGLDDKLLEEALADYLERKVRIPIRAATASANKEVTKQNELLLSQAVMAHNKEMSAMLQAIDNANTPPHYKGWLVKVVKAKNRLMRQIIRDFQITDQPEEFIPDIEGLEQFEEKHEQKPPGQSDPRVLSMANSIRQPGGPRAAVPGAGLATPGAGAAPEAGNLGG
jgi:hypothetical protein